MLDATPSGTSADSYVDLTAANQIASDFALDDFSGATDTVKEQALRQAAMDIDAHRFHASTPYVDGQRRTFPRERDEGVIPFPVQYAQVVQADWLVQAGVGDLAKFEGKDVAPLGKRGAGSPLTQKALRVLEKFIARTGEYV